MRLAFVVMMLLASALPARAVERVALVIGNGDYSAVSPLDNAARDAALLAGTLRPLGFDVTLVENATRDELIRAVAEFGRRLRVAGPETVGLFYYAGHGVQSFGANYLLPVDTELTVAADLDLVGLEAASVLRQMASARNRINIVILDACRNNPFESIPDLNDNGLAEMKAPTGTFLSYATAPGSVALDGLDGNSPFTKALAREIPSPGLPIEQLFKNVRVQVIAETNGQQTPWDTSSLTSDFFFEAGAPLDDQQVAEAQLWESVKDSTDPVPVVLFMRGYPDSKFIPEARALLEKIINSELSETTSAAQAPAPAEAPTLEIAVPEPTPEQAPVDTTKEQERLIAVAQASGAGADFQAYLDAFPEGIYAEFAAFELKIIEEKAARAAAAAQAAPQPQQGDTVVASRAAAAPMGTELTWEMPFTSGGEFLLGKSIEQLVTLSPQFPPIEGLPEELWKDQTCSNCHQWTKEALCTQGQTYVNAGNSEAVSKQHPYGGGFKMNVRSWAEGGCK